MPRIRFFESDNTGSTPVSDFAGVFVPGTAKFVTSENDGLAKPDSNNCIYLPSTTTDLSSYIQEESYSSDAPMNSYHMVEYLLSLGYGVVYKYVGDIATTETSENEVDYYIPVSGVTEENFDNYELYILSTTTFIVADEFSDSATYYVKHSDVTSKLSAIDWTFLNDKNAYPIKFITAGPFGMVKVSEGTSQGTQKFAFDFSLVNAFQPVATDRKDCTILVDLDYSGVETALAGSGNELVRDFKEALESNGFELPKGLEQNSAIDLIYQVVNGSMTALQGADLSSISNEFNKTDTRDMNHIDTVGSRCAALVPNCTMNYNTHDITVPSSFVYLYDFETQGSQTSVWLPMSGVNRGVVGSVFTPDLDISKYLMDTQIITDDEGISFNAIVNVRPYGDTIWGDRTLLAQEQGRGVQATSYLSIRNLISDIAITAYNSAIRNTYETNNDVTWFNFKQEIVTLLDQMVSSGVLQTYKIGRTTTPPAGVHLSERNSIFCVITLYPNLPVENFTISTNLENAEITVSDSEN